MTWQDEDGLFRLTEGTHEAQQIRRNTVSKWDEVPSKGLKETIEDILLLIEMNKRRYISTRLYKNLVDVIYIMV